MNKWWGGKRERLQEMGIVLLSLVLIGIALPVIFRSAGVFYWEFWRYRYLGMDPFWEFVYPLVWAGILFIVSMVGLYYLNWYKSLYVFAYMWRMIIIFLLFPIYESTYFETFDAFIFYSEGIWRFRPSLVFGAATLSIESVVSWIHAFLGPSYRLVIVIFGTLSWWASIMFDRVLLSKIKEDLRKHLLEVLLFFEPMFLLWSSHYGKDPILYVFSVVTSLLLYRFSREPSIKKAVWVLLSLVPFMYFRFWYVAIYGAVLYVLWVVYTRGRKRVVGAVLGGVVAVGGALVVFRLFEISNLNAFLGFIIKKSQAWAHGGAAQRVTITSWGDLARVYPWMWFTALFRPLLWDAHNMFAAYAALVNTGLLAYFLFSLGRLKRMTKEERRLFFLALVVVTIWGGAYAVISYQNLGAAVRYRTPIWHWMLIFFTIVGVGTDKEEKAREPECT
ncbi:hypothetical protein Spith_1614 [Spirochaeta thermophila DSM 6578]|uniref:Uncharacterized protein n=1 Tax=Winmispira thermophila (strain ATCC 700085 / DSM 6578 / Z-1203) TaxID=869211 RepID=G0GAX9_WINT7|nr:hypothetical protein [Spirochaeta thermophila]AEJ61875.1 hypothetical protein Spith_1614 [Spirochaeta thermophila DSM 6578]